MTRGYLTPSTIPATLTRRWICIPDEQYIVAAVMGAMQELCYPYNWQEFGAITPDEIAQAFTPIVMDFMATESACMPIIHQPVIIRDDKTQNTAGGTFTSGAWRKRTLNTLIDQASYGVTLSSDEFTLPAGKWLIRWHAPAFGVGRHQSRLFEVTGNTVVEVGSSESSNTTSSTSNPSVGEAIQTNVAATKYRIEHQCQTTLATEGFGRAANFAAERYALVECYPIT